MSVLKALAQPPIRTIWLGQVLAATGGEFYTVAIIWTAVDLIGSDAGYLSALQSGSYLFGSLFAGIFTDRWTHGRPWSSPTCCAPGSCWPCRWPMRWACCRSGCCSSSR
ncbi:MAG: hypothetical protein WDN69_27980 [Aliidongia sp.]